MEIKAENKNNELILTMVFDKAEWESAVDTAYKKTAGKYKIQGFRNGKAPRKMIEQQYGAGIFTEEAINGLFTKPFEKYLDENPKVRLADYPHLDFDFTKDGGIKIIVSCVTEPEVKLGQYTGLEVKKTEMTVGDEEVDKYIERIRESRAKQVAADKGYKIAVGDIAVIDFAGSVDGEYFEGGTAKNYELHIGDGKFIDNFEEQLIGLTIGDQKEVNVKFPDNYGAENLKGKSAKFEVTVNNILKRILPAVDDEFVKEIGEFTNLADFKKDVKKRMQDAANTQSKTADEEKLLAMVADGAAANIPDVMVERHLDEVMGDMEHELSHQGATLEQYAQYMNTTVEQMRQQQKKYAAAQVKVRLVMDAIIDKEGLHDKDRRKQFDKLREFLSKNNKIV
jgi:trigger factor